MKKTISIFLTVAIVLSISGVATAGFIPVNQKAKNNSQGPEHSPVITETAGEWELDRVDFIHYAKPSNPGGGKGKGGGDTSCFKLMGVKWKTLPIDYVINPTNSGLPEVFVTDTIGTSAETWDAETSAELFNNTYTVDNSAQYGIQDYENVIDFGDYPRDGVIGVTTVWYTRKGKQIVEFDMRLDTDYTWGDATVNPIVMDLRNILVHEFGHSVGLSDIYTDACSTVTMYGYSTEGETSKRDLEAPDIQGLQQMYGE